jgi:sulfide dehydrogenase cytochrome subunit
MRLHESAVCDAVRSIAESPGLAHAWHTERETPRALPQPGEQTMTYSIRLAATLALAAACAAHAQDANLGRDLAASCANCHGTNGQAKGDTVKPLAGVSADKILAALADYKSGAQPATIMHQIAKGYTDDQVRLIAAFFAAQPAKK